MLVVIALTFFGCTKLDEKGLDKKGEETNKVSNNHKNVVYNKDELVIRKKIDTYLAEFNAVKSELKNIYKFKYDKNRSDFILIREQMPDFLNSLQQVDCSSIKQKLGAMYSEFEELTTLNGVYNTSEVSEAKLILSANIDDVITKCTALVFLLELENDDVGNKYFIEHSEIDKPNNKKIIAVGTEEKLMKLMYELYFVD